MKKTLKQYTLKKIIESNNRVKKRILTFKSKLWVQQLVVDISSKIIINIRNCNNKLRITFPSSDSAIACFPPECTATVLTTNWLSPGIWRGEPTFP